MIAVLATGTNGVKLMGSHEAALSWEALREAAWQEDRDLRRAYAAAWAQALTQRAVDAVQKALRMPRVTSCMGYSYRNMQRDDALRGAASLVDDAIAELDAWRENERALVALVHVVAERVEAGDFRDNADAYRRARGAESQHAAHAAVGTNEPLHKLRELSDELADASKEKG
jgi:hypothetical protein